MSGAGRRGARQVGLTAVAEDYLKVVWNLQEWSDEPVTTSHLARRLGVGAPSVSETLGRLVARGWVEHERYGQVRLTAAGRAIALRVVRRHRLIETWLVEQLGYGWDEVHDEAEVLEHAVSDVFVERLDALLGRPRRDPHGDPIPQADGTVERPDAVVLATLAPGRRGRVVRVDDEDPQVLRECERRGVRLDAVLVAPGGLSPAAAAAVRVRPLA
ncbi:MULTISPECIES: metal-dependent transcriptional regulator [unclassified Actinotalea]|uniref:metal-dependent transcriptional regulator n=1 Tax=unclassified Actinotalea TaxID=2638618 RepID=UPI0015F4EC89|nr:MULTISPECIES: metal-dependent transcriptional regulator [unclassified Actinotalea]